MGLQLGEGLLITIGVVLLLLITVVITYREYKVSQRIIKESKQWKS